MAMDIAHCYIRLYSLLGTDLSPTTRPYPFGRIEPGKFSLAVFPYTIDILLERTPCELSGLCGHRLFTDRTEQPIHHHPHARLRTDLHLFFAGHRLSGNASAPIKRKE